MELEFKPGFEHAREKWDAFWKGENTRPLLHIVGPKDSVEPAVCPAPYECTFADDLSRIIDRVLAWASTHEFLADAIPSYRITFAPDHFAALLGAGLKRHPDSPNTIWPEPCIRSWDDAEIVFRRDGYWWRRTVEVIRAFRERCDGKLIISGCHLQGGLDCLCALRGADQVLWDLVDALPVQTSNGTSSRG